MAHRTWIQGYIVIGAGSPLSARINWRTSPLKWLPWVHVGVLFLRKGDTKVHLLPAQQRLLKHDRQPHLSKKKKRNTRPIAFYLLSFPRSGSRFILCFLFPSFWCWILEPPLSLHIYFSPFTIFLTYPRSFVVAFSVLCFSRRKLSRVSNPFSSLFRWCDFSTFREQSFPYLHAYFLLFLGIPFGQDKMTWMLYSRIVSCVLPARLVITLSWVNCHDKTYKGKQGALRGV